MIEPKKLSLKVSLVIQTDFISQTFGMEADLTDNFLYCINSDRGNLKITNFVFDKSAWLSKLLQLCFFVISPT